MVKYTLITSFIEQVKQCYKYRQRKQPMHHLHNYGYAILLKCNTYVSFRALEHMPQGQKLYFLYSQYKLYIILQYFRKIRVMLIWKFIRPSKLSFVYSTHNKLINSSTLIGSVNNKIIFRQQPSQSLPIIKKFQRLSLKEFSVSVHKLLTVQKNKDPIIWKEIQGEFLSRLTPTTNSQEIRSHSKIIYTLSKSKLSSLNYQNKIAILLPFASKQSFTTMVMAISRMGPMSRQFGYIVQKLYYERKDSLNIREKVQLNYTLTKNGYYVDKSLISDIHGMNCNEIMLMLRSFDQSSSMNSNILQISEKAIIARKNEINVLDLGDIMVIYFKYLQISERMERLLTQVYFLLRKHIDELFFQKFWVYFPQIVNEGKLQIKLIRQIIKTLSILRRKGKFIESVWKNIKKSKRQFNNLQIRAQLDQIK